MADWRDNLRPASFRGVPFFVNDHSASGGRRGVTHQFGGRDEPYREDLGRMARTRTVQAYVIGDDYMEKRDRLLDALEEPGPGALVHPWLGAYRAVAAQRYDLTERTDKGRYAAIAITFEEAGEVRFPAAAVSRRREVAVKADTAAAAAGTSFAARFNVAGKPAFVAGEAETLVTGFLGDLQARANSVRGAFEPVWSAVNLIGDTIGQVSTLARTPADLGNRVRSLVGGFAALIPAGRASFRPLLEFSLWGDDDPGLSVATPSRVQVAANQTEILRLVRRTSTAEAARKLTETPADETVAFTSLQGALAARDDVLTAIDAEIDAAGASGEHDVFVAFGGLRAETIRFVNEEAARLPSLRGWTPAATQPAAVIAYRLYDDATRAAETARRNRIRHPGFVPGGQELQVLDA